MCIRDSYAVTLNAQGGISKKEEIKDADGSIWWNELKNSIKDQSFSLKIPDSYKKKTLMLEFETFILDNVEAGSTVTNAVQLAPNSGSTGLSLIHIFIEDTQYV